MHYSIENFLKDALASIYNGMISYGKQNLYKSVILPQIFFFQKNVFCIIFEILIKCVGAE